MEITKWDLFKQIEQMPAEKYKIIKDFLDQLIQEHVEEIELDEETKKELEISYAEYQKGEFLTFDQVFEDDGKS